jgi:hypothetical protein
MAAFSFVFYMFRYVVSVCNILTGSKKSPAGLRETMDNRWGLAFIRLNRKLFRLIIIAQLSLGEKYSLCFWFVLYNFFMISQ